MVKTFLKKLMVLTLTVAILAAAACTACAAPNEDIPALDASSAILVDADRGQILYGKATSKRLHISIANKIMTAILAIEKAGLGDKVTISKESANVKGSLLNLEVGEKYSLENLLYAAILTSANDAASAVAEYVGGDVNKFVDLMNAKANELKMANTVFKNPTGLYDESQYTTAHDLSVLVRYAISNSTFERIFSSRGIPWSDGDNSKILLSSNNLFWSYDGVDGGKTGFNDKNSQSAVTTATRNNLRLVSVVTDSPEDSVFKDSEQLLNYGFTGFKKGILVEKGQSLKNLSVNDMGLKLVSSEDIYYTHPIGDNYIIKLEIKTEQTLNPPITRDMVLGIATYILKDNTIIDVKLYSDTDIKPAQDSLSYFLNKIKAHRDLFLIVVFLLIVELILAIYNINRFIRKKLIENR